MYRLILQFWNKPITPDITKLDSSFWGLPRVYGDTVKNGRKLIPLIGQPDFDTSTLPIFDYFHLKTSDSNKLLWERCLLDVHQMDGIYSPSNFCMYVSPKFKGIVSKYALPAISGLILSKLKYKGKKIDYYIFNCTIFSTFNDLRYSESTFQIFNNRLDGKFIADYENKINNYLDWQSTVLELRKKQQTIYTKKAVLSKYYDFFMLYGDVNFYVSERLKKDLEANNITGIDFLEVTDREFQFLETPPPIGNSL